VLLRTEEISDIRKHTFLDPNLLIGGIVQPNGSLRFDWSLDDIEEIQGYVAASANHCDDSKLEKRLDRIFSKLQRSLDSYRRPRTFFRTLNQRTNRAETPQSGRI
jgi:hypothetical protein